MDNDGNATRIIATGEKWLGTGAQFHQGRRQCQQVTLHWAYCHMPHDGDPDECFAEVKCQLGWDAAYPEYVYDSWYEYSEHSNKLLVLVIVEE